MATTTNYGWDTPDDTDLVKDGAAAIRTLGSSVDTTTKNLNPQTTTGALAYRSATANVNTALPIGTNGQVLTVAAGVPSWATPAGGGKVLQVVNLTLTSGNFTTSSTSFVDVTSLSLAITPAAATSKIMMFLTTTCSGTSTSGGANVDMRFALVRTSTILTEARFDLENNTGSTTALGMPVTLTYLDSPSTTSATTYKLQVKKVNYSDTITVQANATNKAMLTLMEIGA
jgi:hypothetical protein